MFLKNKSLISFKKNPINCEAEKIWLFLESWHIFVCLMTSRKCATNKNKPIKVNYEPQTLGETIQLEPSINTLLNTLKI